MAIQSLGYGQESWWPAPLQGVTTYNYDVTTFLLDASGEKLDTIVQIPLTGTLDRFLVQIAAVTDAPDNGLRYSFQDVSLTDGTVDGVVDQFATVASGSVVTGFLDPGAFDATRAVTRGALLGCVIDFPTFVAGDSVTIASLSAPGGGSVLGFPYAILNTAKSLIRYPRLWLHYTDSGGFWVPVAPYGMYSAPTTSVGSTVSIDTASTPDEVGNAFTLPASRRLSRIVMPIQIVQAGGTFDLILYDSGNSVVDTVSYDGDVFSSAIGNTRIATFVLSASPTLTVGALYRVIVKPTSANNVAAIASTLDATLFSQWAGGNCYRTQRTDAGSWTNFNNGTDGYQWVHMALGFDGDDDAVQTGSTNFIFVPE